jgi:hypothetical protein
MQVFATQETPPSRTGTPGDRAVALGAGNAAQRVPVHSLADCFGEDRPPTAAALSPRMRQPTAAVQLDGPQNTLESALGISPGVFSRQTFPFHSATSETLEESPPGKPSPTSMHDVLDRHARPPQETDSKSCAAGIRPARNQRLPSQRSKELPEIPRQARGAAHHTEAGAATPRAVRITDQCLPFHLRALGAVPGGRRLVRPQPPATQNRAKTQETRPSVS